MFSLWLYFACKELFSAPTLLLFSNVYANGKHFWLAAVKHESRVVILGLKWSIEFWPRSEIGYGKSQSLVGNRARVSRLGPLIPSKNFVEFHLGTRINKSMSKQKITLFFFSYRQFRFVNVKSIK